MQQRQHPRFAVELAATVTGAKGAPLEAITRDISGGGICLLIEVPPGAPPGWSPIPVGSRAHLALQLVFDADTASEPLELPLKVIWCTPHAGRLQIGGKFVDMTAEQADYLAMFLRFLAGDVNE